MFATAFFHRLSAVSFQSFIATLPPPDSYQAVGWVCLVLVAIASAVLVVLQIIKVIRELRASNNPQNVRVTNPLQRREVTFPPEFTTKDDCDSKHERMQNELEVLRADVVARDEASKRSRENIHMQLTRLETGMATLEERSKNTDGWLEKVDRKLSDVAEGLANVAGRIK